MAECRVRRTGGIRTRLRVACDGAEVFTVTRLEADARASRSLSLPPTVMNPNYEGVQGAERQTYSCIHECLELSMNTGCWNYHEYEYIKAQLIMSMNSKRKAIFNSTHMNRFLIMPSSG